MINKIKDALGIEGVKIDLKLEDSYNYDDNEIRGSILLSTLSDKRITSLQINLVETYQRGRNDDKRIDDYVIGMLEQRDAIELKKGEIQEIGFILPYFKKKSEVDQWAESNIFGKALSKLAKTVNGVKSHFYIVAKANVYGTRLQPVVKKEITFE